MNDWKRLSDIMKDNAGNAWELRIPREGRKDTGKVRPSHLSIKIKI